MAADAGYSGTPLPKKLGIKEASTVLVIGSPPPDLEIQSNVGPRATGVDVLLVFVTEEAEFAAKIAAWGDRIDPDGGLWICWPKKSARKIVPSDMTEDAVRAHALPLGLVDNKVCAIDDVWSGLRVVWRTELRPARRDRTKRR